MKTIRQLAAWLKSLAAHWSHTSLGSGSPYFRSTCRMPDVSFSSPFGCSMVVFLCKDLVEPGKLAP